MCEVLPVLSLYAAPRLRDVLVSRHFTVAVQPGAGERVSCGAEEDASAERAAADGQAGVQVDDHVEEVCCPDLADVLHTRVCRHTASPPASAGNILCRTASVETPE
jgi:hypothetical protein